jgi:hypothetical protein
MKYLERPVASSQELESHVVKAHGLADAAGVPAARGMDILMLCPAMAQAWNMTSESVRDAGNAEKMRLKQHREALILAVTATANALS